MALNISNIYHPMEKMAVSCSCNMPGREVLLIENRKDDLLVENRWEVLSVEKRREVLSAENGTDMLGHSKV